MKIRDAVFLVLAFGVAIFLRMHYLSGLYYDIDVASRGYQAFSFLRGQDLSFFFRGVFAPGATLLYSLAFFLFGLSFTSLQIFAAAFDLASLSLLYLLGRFVISRHARFYFVLPLLCAPFLSSEVFQGNSANLETFLVPLEIAAFLFLGFAAKRDKYIFYGFAGVFLGLAVLIKQSAFSMWLAGVLFILILSGLNKAPFRSIRNRLVIYSLPFVLPMLFFAFYAGATGHLWSFVTNKILLVGVYLQGNAHMKNVYFSWTFEQIMASARFELASLGVLVLLGTLSTLCTKARRAWERILIVSWFALPVLIIAQGGLHFRHHYLEILVPFLTLAVVGFSDLYEFITIRSRGQVWVRVVMALTGSFVLVFTALHGPLSLVQRGRVKDSLFLTERYMDSSPDNREKYTNLLLRADFDAARRFLAGRYIAEHDTENGKICVWDYLGCGAVNFWAGRESVLYYLTKTTFLPVELKDPAGLITQRYFRNKYSNHLFYQQRLMERLEAELPAYIVIVKSAKPMPNAPPIEQTMAQEKKAFAAFFAFLAKGYHLETDIYGCQIYKRIAKK